MSVPEGGHRIATIVRVLGFVWAGICLLGACGIGYVSTQLGVYENPREAQIMREIAGDPAVARAEGYMHAGGAFVAGLVGLAAALGLAWVIDGFAEKSEPNG